MLTKDDYAFLLQIIRGTPAQNLASARVLVALADKLHALLNPAEPVEAAPVSEE